MLRVLGKFQIPDFIEGLLLSTFCYYNKLTTKFVKTRQVLEVRVWKIGLTGLTSMCQQGCFCSGSSRNNLFSCLLQLLKASSIPWIFAPSSIFKASRVASSNLSLPGTKVTWPFLILTSSCLLLRTLVIILSPPG